MEKIIKYEDRIVAFIDILGFKEIIKDSERDNTQIGSIYKTLEYLKALGISNNWTTDILAYEECAQYKGIETFEVKNKLNSTAFSDSIVVSIKVEENINEMASALIVNLAYVGAELMQQGILIRGGITVGKLIHSENGIVLGQGLIDAFTLETKSAKYPRIILSDKLIKQLNYPIYTKPERFPYHQYLDRFADGCVGFHQMMFYQVMGGTNHFGEEELKAELDMVRKNIIKGLDSSFENPSVHEKYLWLKEEYGKLLILSDSDYDTQTQENIKIKIREINEGIPGQNIHYAYTDNFYEQQRGNK